jgi:hypothetical protein
VRTLGSPAPKRFIIRLTSGLFVAGLSPLTRCVDPEGALGFEDAPSALIAATLHIKEDYTLLAGDVAPKPAPSLPVGLSAEEIVQRTRKDILDRLGAQSDALADEARALYRQADEKQNASAVVFLAAEELRQQFEALDKVSSGGGDDAAEEGSDS